MQVWNLWLFQLSIFLLFLLPFFFCVVLICGGLFWLQLRGRCFTCKLGNVGERPLKTQSVTTIIAYCIPSLSAGMQWMVWCFCFFLNAGMWFIFTVNVKSFNFGSACINYIPWLQTSRLWMMQIVHNKKSHLVYSSSSEGFFLSLEKCVEATHVTVAHSAMGIAFPAVLNVSFLFVPLKIYIYLFL